MVDGSELTPTSSEVRQIEARRPFSVMAIIFFLIALGFVVLAFTAGAQEPMIHLLMLAAWPFLLGVACWVTRGKGFQAELLPELLRVHSPKPIELPYSGFQAVQREGRGKSKHFPIHIIHESGVVSIPVNTKTSSEELLKLVAAKIPISILNDLPDELHAIYQKHVNTFGSDRVFAYSARKRKINGIRGLRGIGISLAFILSGFIWLFNFAEKPKAKDDTQALGVFGGSFIFFGFLAFFYYNSRRRLYGGTPKWINSGLVVSPLGVAMIQGEVRGEMKWNELAKLTYATKPPFWITTSNYSPIHIRLVISGGVAMVFDIYTHPLIVIYDTMKQFWGK